MKKLAYDLIKLCEQHDPGGSYATRKNRQDMLGLMAAQLHEMGYKTMRAGKLGGRHVNRLVQLWKSQELSIGAMKNRMSVLRWWAGKVGRGHVVARGNDHYGIPSRPLGTVSKAVELSDDLLQRIDGPYRERIGVSLCLQRYLGMRTEESVRWCAVA